MREQLACVGRQQQGQRLRRRDQDVRRSTRELRTLARGRVAERTATLGTRYETPCRSATARDAGDRRAQVAFDIDSKRLSGETYTTFKRSERAGSGENIMRSSAVRNAGSVLPEPVGARSSVDPPRTIGPKPCDWAGVGRSNDSSNHARTGP